LRTPCLQSSAAEQMEVELTGTAAAAAATASTQGNGVIATYHVFWQSCERPSTGATSSNAVPDTAGDTRDSSDAT